MNRDEIESFERLAYLQQVNYDMMESFRNGLFWLIDYCEKNHPSLPDLTRVQQLLTTSGSLLEQSEFINREVTHTKSTDKEPEPFSFTVFLG